MNEEPAKDAYVSDEERARALREQLKQVHAFDIAFEMAVSLVSFGYQKLGLTTETRELRDLGDARVAIELLRAELDVLSRELGDARLGDLRASLAQLQLSYARAVGAAGEGPGEAAASAASAGEAAGEAAAREDEPAPAGPDASAEVAAAPAEQQRLARKKATPAKSAARKPADRKKAAPAESAATKKPAERRKPAPAKPAAKKKPSARKKPAGQARATRRTPPPAGAGDEPPTST